MEWTYSQPVKLIFGTGKVESLDKIFAGFGLKNGLLVSDPVFVKNGLASKVSDYSRGALIEVFSDITPNPTVTNVDDCARLIREKNIEFVAALGGGSSLDCAKAACSVCRTPYSVVEFHSGKRKFEKDFIPLIAIPTTSGTGSEVTPVAVLSDPERGVKAPLVSDNFFPMCAIIDAALTLTVPSAITASTGMDVLSHALEGFWSKNHQPICDAMALHSARLVFEYLLPAYLDAGNLEAREKMSEASVMAGLAFGLPKTAGSHACSFPLTSVYHIPHGEACAFTLDAFTRINAEAENGRLHGFARMLGFTDAYGMADSILEMKRAMNMKITLADAGIPEEKLEELARLSQHPNMLNNPVAMDLESILKMYRSLKEKSR
ncbi:alcohol dehydrogenase [Anaerobacterium chartisolvens]|uniref:Alcohol dehydrogenase n=1 Tax=Anaerobacterium chartisolvens TaxID=1297424 RepID=A0A369BF95_9FIRM|nr:iron-containing alcohol dehydrogenase family protein [Anaerobacterium chartisolvens]RCX20091.1 alcohol dehydrogenase [Anaerobacterium chartisolvens]